LPVRCGVERHLRSPPLRRHPAPIRQARPPDRRRIRRRSGFAQHPDALRRFWASPDTYEIGISNQAIQILYGLAGQTEGVAVERTYLPWVDAIAAMRRDNVPLLTLETTVEPGGRSRPGSASRCSMSSTSPTSWRCSIWAGIPLVAAQRGKSHLWCWRGPGVRQLPAPESPSSMPCRVGDGEELFCEILEVMAGPSERGRPARSGQAQLAQGGGCTSCPG